MYSLRFQTGGLSYRLFCIRVIVGSAFLLTFTAAAIICGCSGWTINGIHADELRAAEAGELAKMAGGMLASMAVHTAAHIVYLEATGTAWHMDGTSEIPDEAIGGDRQQWFGRIGFVSQLAVGGLLELADVDRHFTAGYHMGSAAQTWSYPLLHDGRRGDDLRMIDDGGGHGRLEWAAYGVAAGFLLLDREPQGQACNGRSARTGTGL